MTYLADILDIAALEQHIADRYINRVVSPDGKLHLYNYSSRASFDGVWTTETRLCRGLVADAATGTIVAWPFSKFSNIDERGFPESTLTALLARSGPIEITDKLDGSMVAIWYDPTSESWRCTTRGSFISGQALAALEWLQARFDLAAWPQSHTFIGEWCAPDNRVVLRYGEAELRLIGARTTAGDDAPYAELLAWSQRLGLPIVPVVAGYSLEELVAQGALALDIEGWVARWPDGFRVKIKTSDYQRLHQLISGFSAARVREMMLAGATDRYLSELPEELRPEAEVILAMIRQVADARAQVLAQAFERLRPLLAQSRKDFALAVQQELPDDRPYLFALADSKPIDERIIKSLDLLTLFGERAEAQGLDDG